MCHCFRIAKFKCPGLVDRLSLPMGPFGPLACPKALLSAQHVRCRKDCVIAGDAMLIRPKAPFPFQVISSLAVDDPTSVRSVSIVVTTYFSWNLGFQERSATGSWPIRHIGCARDAGQAAKGTARGRRCRVPTSLTKLRSGWRPTAPGPPSGPDEGDWKRDYGPW